jgi:hypothetical protein
MTNPKPAGLSGPRNPDGTFARGNWISVRHGLRSERPEEIPPELQFLQTEVREFAEACLADEGDADAITARRRSLIEYRGRLDRRIRQVDSLLELSGALHRLKAVGSAAD